MLSVLAKLGRWVATKAAIGAAIVVIAVVGFGLWAYVKDNVAFDQWRQDALRAITGERTKLRAALQDVEARLQALSSEITERQEKIRQAEKIIAQLKQLDNAWDRYVGNPEQQKLNDARVASLSAQRDDWERELTERRDRFTRTTWEKDGLQIALGKLDAEWQKVEAKRSKLAHYLEQTWNYPVGHGAVQLPLKHWVWISLAAYFLGPLFMKALLYFGLGGWIARSRPVRLAAPGQLPDIAPSGVVADICLDPGERLWVKEAFLQASDEGLSRRTRYVLEPRLPFTCLATGLTELIEVTRAPEAADGEQRVTLSNQKDPHSELTVATLEEGASLVLRPSFLAGVTLAPGQRLKVRKHWQFWRAHAWLKLQFRHFEFVGPCRLVIAGSRGVRVETLAPRDGGAMPARRTNQDATIGFTPGLEHRLVRAETFWSYLRGMNPLFDDLFAGRGLFLCQQVATPGDKPAERKVWETLWSGVLRVFGL